jgi:integrase
MRNRAANIEWTRWSLGGGSESRRHFAFLIHTEEADMSVQSTLHDETGTAVNVPWNKGRLIGQKSPLKLSEILAIRVRLQIAGGPRDLAPFNLAIDSERRSCDLVGLRVQDVASEGRAECRATAMQQKTSQPVRFELMEQTRQSVERWIQMASLTVGDYLFQSRLRGPPHLSTREYTRILQGWVSGTGRVPSSYGMHAMRRTKATLVCRRTKNLRAMQLLLGHTKLESTVRYLGIEVDDALEMSGQTEL